MNKTSKLISVVLALLMLFGAFGVTAFAENSEELTEPEVSVPSSGESEPPSGEVSVETPPVEDSSEVVEYCRITVLIPVGGASVEYGSRVYDGVSAGNECVLSVPMGSTAVISVTPDLGYSLSSIAVGTVDTYNADEATGIITIQSVSRNADIKVELTDAESFPVSVEVVGEGGKVSYENDFCYAGSVFDLTLRPADGYGVKSVTVNGEEIKNAPLGYGIMNIEITEESVITVEYSQLWEVSVECGNGGAYSVAGMPSSTASDVIGIPSGREVEIVAVPDEGMTVDKIEFVSAGESYDKSVVSFTLEQNERIKISFKKDDGERDNFLVVTEVVGEGGGIVIPDQATYVKKGGSITVKFVADLDCEIDYVKVNGYEWTVIDGSITIKDVKEDLRVRVKFKPLEETSGEDVPEPEESIEIPDVPTGDKYTASSILSVITMGNDGILNVSLGDITVLDKSALEHLNTVLKDSGVSIGVDGAYKWIIPEGASLGLVDSLDFGVVFDGAYTQVVKSYFEDRAQAEGQSGATPIIVVERNVATAFPKNTLLSVNAVAITADSNERFVAGNKAEWIKYTPLSDGYSSFAGDKLFQVDDNGYITVPMSSDSKYGVFRGYVGNSSCISIVYDDKMCGFDVYGTVSKTEEGLSVNTILQKSGTDFTVTVCPKDGFCIQKISGDYESITLYDESGNDITKGNYAGVHGEIKVTVSGVSADGKITVVMADEDASSKDDGEDKSGGPSIQVIILIIVISVVMIGGGVFFVIKWRQSEDDDDEYEDDDDYEDDEDDE